ncbi:hypothetical protein G5714_022183 [Onychostoma macrolepis]|uniref:Apolipo L3-like protein n=1 Tax=Onychostoma macrolepis TaxID=369639 RepID=A0A7J6BMK7_9TELE|nr:hypothetical protein G5714_022183 [Onychostoma macrolepis]
MEVNTKNKKYNEYIYYNKFIRRRAQLEDRLTAYVKDTLEYIETIRDFCDQEQKWTSERKAELEKMRDISENQEQKELDAVLKDTLEGLKKLEPFLDAVEKLAVTSSHVFSGQIFLLWGESPERVQSVITDARTDAPLLIHFKRDAETFFRPLLDNVNILIFQLNNYVLETEQLCRRVRRKRNEHTRLAFLFQENAQKFIDVFSERRSRMWLFLSDLEETAVKLDSMKFRGSIFTVTSSLVGILGGVLSITGIILAPFTAGASLAFTVAGAVGGGISAASTVATEITETAINSHHERNAQSYLKSYKDDMIKIEDCLKEAANSERPLVQPSADYAPIVLHGAGEVLKEAANVVDAVAGHKSEKVGLTNVKLSEITTEELNTARGTSVVRLSKTGSVFKLANISKVVSGITNVFFIGLDGYFIVKESISLHNGSKSEVSKLIRSRAALWKSELEAWEKIHDSLCIGIETINESQDTLEKPFLP